MLLDEAEKWTRLRTLPLTSNLFPPKSPMIAGRIARAPSIIATAVQVIRAVAMMKSMKVRFMSSLGRGNLVPSMHGSATNRDGTSHSPWVFLPLLPSVNIVYWQGQVYDELKTFGTWGAKLEISFVR
jgi:hypothetical protein